MYSSSMLNSSVRRKTGINNYLISSDSSELEVEINENESIINTPERKNKSNSENEAFHSNKSEFNAFPLRPSVSLATSVRRRAYYIGSSDESEEEYDFSEIEDTRESLSETQQETDNFSVQPCIPLKSEFEPCDDNSLKEQCKIGNRRRNGSFNSDNEYQKNIRQRLSIKYQSSVRRKNNSKRFLNIVDSDSESDENLKRELRNRRSSFCIGPELIEDKSGRMSSLESDTAWISLESDLNSDLKTSSVDSLNDFEWKTAVDSLSEREHETRSNESVDSSDQVSLFSKEATSDSNSVVEIAIPNDTELVESTKQYKKKNNSKSCFIRKRNSLADFWYQVFNREVFNSRLPAQVPIKWTGRLQRTAAQTLFITGNDGSKRVVIKLSKYVLDCEYRLKKTLLHECCHVAQFLLDSCVKPPHGQVFLKWGKLATKKYPELKVEIYHNYEIIYRYRYHCLRCYQIFGRQKRINNFSETGCPKCNGNIVFIGKGTLNGHTAPKINHVSEDFGRSKSKQNPYSNFVKEKFAEYKRDIFLGKTPSRRAPSILKEIAKIWKQKKSSLTDEFEKLSINH